MKSGVAILLCLLSSAALADPSHPSQQQFVPNSARNFFHPTELAAYEFSSRGRRAHSSTACLPAMVKAALAKADAACGIKVISTFRPGARIATTGQVSKHASCRGADFTTKNVECVRSALHDYRGTMSTDYYSVSPNHFHIDDGGYLRFAHGAARRYAKRGGKRYAQAPIHQPGTHNVW